MPLSCKRCSKCAVKMAYLDPVNSIRSQGTNLPKWARCSLREIKISGVLQSKIVSKNKVCLFAGSHDIANCIKNLGQKVEKIQNIAYK